MSQRPEAGGRWAGSGVHTSPNKCCLVTRFRKVDPVSGTPPNLRDVALETKGQGEWWEVS